MKIIKSVVKTVYEEEGIECDCCKKKIFDVLDLEEIFCIEHQCGYSSIFGDGSLLQLDLCQHCLREFLGEFARITT